MTNKEKYIDALRNQHTDAPEEYLVIEDTLQWLHALMPIILMPTPVPMDSSQTT